MHYQCIVQDLFLFFVLINYYNVWDKLGPVIVKIGIFFDKTKNLLEIIFLPNYVK